MDMLREQSVKQRKQWPEWIVYAALAGLSAFMGLAMSIFTDMLPYMLRYLDPADRVHHYFHSFPAEPTAYHLLLSGLVDHYGIFLASVPLVLLPVIGLVLLGKVSLKIIGRAHYNKFWVTCLIFIAVAVVGGCVEFVFGNPKEINLWLGGFVDNYGVFLASVPVVLLFVFGLVLFGWVLRKAIGKDNYKKFWLICLISIAPVVVAAKPLEVAFGDMDTYMFMNWVRGSAVALPGTAAIALKFFFLFLSLVTVIHWIALKPQSPFNRGARNAYFAALGVAALGLGALYFLHFKPAFRQFEAMRFASVRAELGIPGEPRDAYLTISFVEPEPVVSRHEAVIGFEEYELELAPVAEENRPPLVTYSTDPESAGKAGSLLKGPDPPSGLLSYDLWWYYLASAAFEWDVEEFQRRSLECLQYSDYADNCLLGHFWLIWSPITPGARELARLFDERVRRRPTPYGVLGSAVICRRLGCGDMDYWAGLAAALPAEDLGRSADRRRREYRERPAPEVVEGVIRGRVILDGPEELTGPIRVGLGYCRKYGVDAPSCSSGRVFASGPGWGSTRLVWALEPDPDGGFEFGSLADDIAYSLVVGIRVDPAAELPLEGWEFENRPGVIDLGPERPTVDLGDIVIRYAPDGGDNGGDNGGDMEAGDDR